MLEKFLFKKIELWLVGLIVVLGLVITMFVGTLAIERERGRDRLGIVGVGAHEFAKLPLTLREVMRSTDPRLAQRADRFSDMPSGWTIFDGAGTTPVSGFLLISRYGTANHEALVELVRLSDFSVVHSWQPDGDALLKDAVRDSAITNYKRWNSRLFRVAHPLLLSNGDLIAKDHETPLMRLDGCAQPLWYQQDDLFHHSTNIDQEGNFWAPLRIEPTDLSRNRDFNDDGIAKVSPTGELLLKRSVSQILIDNGLKHLLFTAGAFQTDPIHLNDIEPVLVDGKYWKQGDLFLSSRHRSLVLQYRPSTNEVIWFQQGPWLAQHDVDIINDHTIAIFNNNAYDSGAGGYIDGVNDIVFLDFETGQLSSPYSEAMKRDAVQTLTEGVYDFTESGHVMIEEENSGRILIYEPDGSLRASFVNRHDDGKIYRLGWSRYVDADFGEAALGALAGVTCAQ